MTPIISNIGQIVGLITQAEMQLHTAKNQAAVAGSIEGTIKELSQAIESVAKAISAASATVNK